MAIKDTEQFCVRWNSYQSNIQSAFPKLLSSEHFVDVTLACESRMVKCHKVVLSAGSAYFERLLVQNPCQHPIIFMKDMKYWEVLALVDFMYKGEVNVTQDELTALLKAAEALEVRGLCGQQEQELAAKLCIPKDIAGTGDNLSQSSSQPESESKEKQFSVRSQESVQSDASFPSSSEQPKQMPSYKQESKDTEKILFDYSESDDDDDNPLMIDSPDTGTSYSYPGTSSQFDSGSEGGSWQHNNYYPNMARSEHSMYASSSGSEAPGKVQRIRRSDAELLNAADSIRRGMTFQQASQVFKIPMSTIRFYMARKGMLPSRRRGRRNSQSPNSGRPITGTGMMSGAPLQLPAGTHLSAHIPSPTGHHQDSLR